MHDLVQESRKLGLKVNKTKTKVMESRPTTIKIDDDHLENVSSYTYLGNHEQGISRRLKLDDYLQEPTFPLCLKKRIFMQCIVPAMMYASETWNLSKKRKMKFKHHK